MKIKRLAKCRSESWIHMTFDDRLVSKEQIVRAKTVLTDMHSLAAFGTTLALKDQNVPWHPEEVPLEDSYAVANVIQSIVLYIRSY